MHRLLCLKASRISLTAVLAAAIIAGCTTRHPAPVVERTAKPKPPIPAAPAASGTQAAPRPGDARPEFYTVRRGDTLYSIALDYGIDYRELALWNGLDNPGALQVGQQLRLSPAPGMVVTAPLKPAPGVEARPLATAPLPPAQGSDGVKTQPKGVRLPYSEQAYAQLANVKPEAGLAPSPAKTDNTAPPAAPEGDELQFAWPASGKIVSVFNDGANLKGIAIAGKAGQPIFASAPGKVIFSGTGIRGFGKLIVIKHNNIFLSVYGHNSELLVKEGQNVSKGQKIAEMGNTDADQVKLHFEIRRFGKPVDPIKLLPERQG
jgi:lipoprotein NlpD